MEISTEFIPALIIVGITIVRLITIQQNHRSSTRPPGVGAVQERRVVALIIGVLLTGYGALSIFTGPGFDLIAALLGTLGIAFLLYSAGREGMLKTILGYFIKRK